MADLYWDAELMLRRYIHDYMVRKNLHISACVFKEEAKVPVGPLAINDSSWGFLMEWWAIFSEMYFVKQPNRETQQTFSETPMFRSTNQEYSMQVLERGSSSTEPWLEIPSKFSMNLSGPSPIELDSSIFLNSFSNQTGWPVAPDLPRLSGWPVTLQQFTHQEIQNQLQGSHPSISEKNLYCLTCNCADMDPLLVSSGINKGNKQQNDASHNKRICSTTDKVPKIAKKSKKAEKMKGPAQNNQVMCKKIEQVTRKRKELPTSEIEGNSHVREISHPSKNAPLSPSQEESSSRTLTESYGIADNKDISSSYGEGILAEISKPLGELVNPNDGSKKGNIETLPFIEVAGNENTEDKASSRAQNGLRTEEKDSIKVKAPSSFVKNDPEGADDEESGDKPSSTA